MLDDLDRSCFVVTDWVNKRLYSKKPIDSPPRNSLFRDNELKVFRNDFFRINTAFVAVAYGIGVLLCPHIAKLRQSLKKLSRKISSATTPASPPPATSAFLVSIAALFDAENQCILKSPHLSFPLCHHC
jgi:hypothetical protein